MTHILIVDDDRKSIAVLAELLNLHGITYTAVNDASKVESVIKTLPQQVDMVLLDLEMPLVNGYKILEMLKTQPAFRNVPVVACTVHSNQKQAVENAGFHSFISKPLDIDRFPDQIQAILHGQPVWDN